MNIIVVNIFCVHSNSSLSLQCYNELASRYTFIEQVESANVILVLGGDGLMLHSMHKYWRYNIPIYGINYGTIGFLMNNRLGKKEDLITRIQSANESKLHVLDMKAYSADRCYDLLAFNEVYLFRDTPQAARLQVKINDNIRLYDFVGDGILLSTPAGSTAYNSSVGGPVLPLHANTTSLMPISPFRPKRWKGALLPYSTVTEIKNLDRIARPVNAVADFHEVKHIDRVIIKEDKNISVNILFDRDKSLEERIIREQFLN